MMPGAESLVCFHMTGATQGNEVRPLTGAAIRKRQDVMHFLCGLENAVLQTLLTQRIGLDLLVTDTLPRSAVGVLIVGTLVSVVEALRLRPVFRTVLFARCRETWAAGVAAGSLGTGWHTPHLLWGKRKAPWDYSHKALTVILSILPLYYFPI